MKQFENRISTKPNRKYYEIEENTITKDESGEITSFIATETRCDEPLVEGTPLEAATLKEIVQNMIDELASVLSIEQLLQLDMNELKINSEISKVEDIVLPKEGRYGTQFTWSVKNSSVITINNELINLNQTYVEEYVTLEVVGTKEGKTKSKEIVVKVLPKDVKEEITLLICPDGSSSMMSSASFNIEENSEVTVENDYSFLVTTSISNNILTVNVYATEYLEGGIMEATFKVFVKDKSTKVLTKDITITVEFIESIEGED